jgi:hypothetical protein
MKTVLKRMLEGGGSEKKHVKQKNCKFCIRKNIIIRALYQIFGLLKGTEQLQCSVEFSNIHIHLAAWKN